jgi:predicted  nucleic acid-binding Zn-ribbon protein
MLGKLKGLIFEEDGSSKAPQQPQVATPIGTSPVAATPGAVQAAPIADDKFVQALRSAIKSRQTAFTALLATADKLANVIPDANMRLKAAYATVAGEGRDVRSILQAIDVHTADLESQRMQFTRQAEDAMKIAVGSKQAELDTIDPSISSAQQQIQALTAQISSLNESIAQKTIRKSELSTEIATEQQRFAGAKQQFETALTIVSSELNGQKAVIQSALA